MRIFWGSAFAKHKTVAENFTAEAFRVVIIYEFQHSNLLQKDLLCFIYLHADVYFHLIIGYLQGFKIAFFLGEKKLEYFNA